MSERFVPPYPAPPAAKLANWRRFVRGWNSWIHVLFDKSYTMKMGEGHARGLSLYVANELSLVERIMVAEWRKFPKHRFLQDILSPLVGLSVFSANGPAWERQRAMVNPAFSHTALQRSFDRMAGAVDAILARFRSEAARGPTVRIDPLMTHFAADVIYRTLFSQELDARAAGEIHRAFVAYQRSAQSKAMLDIYALPTLPFRLRARHHARRIHAVFAPIVRARYDAYQAGERGGYTDILQSLLDARDGESGAAFTFQELMNEVSTVFLAGHETGASAMSWALYLIASCPHLQGTIRAEVEGATGGGALTYEALKAMPAARNTFRETLRLYPPVSFFVRGVVEPTAMRDKQLKPGAMLVVSPWLIQRNSDNWDDPHAFDPDRFDDPAAQGACRHAYMPFGKGPRVCVGAGFAQQEALLLIAAVVRAFRLEPIAGDVPEPVSRLTLRAKNGVRLRVVPVVAV